MVDKKFGKNVLLVILSNAVKLLSSVGTILLPLIIYSTRLWFLQIILIICILCWFFSFWFY